MQKGLVGKKLGMTQLFDANGNVVPVTVIEAGPCVIAQKKTVENDGYDALQVGIEDKRENLANKAELGHVKAANTAPKKFVKELQGDELAKYNVGDEITVDIFQAGEYVDVTGVSKGKGFSGAIKRWHFTIGPKGHGSGYHRGSGTFANNGRCNNRVLPGKKMAGHHGNESATIHNLLVIDVNAEKNYILIKGGLPGPKKSFLTIKSAFKKQFGAKPEIKELVKKAADAE